MTHGDQIGVVGCGYVGLTLAAVLAAAGFRVYAIEVNPDRLRAIQSGKSFFYETGADRLICHGIDSGSLIAGDKYDILANCHIIFSCVGTPDNSDGSSNLSFVFAAAQQAASYMQNDALFVQKSTVPVGTGEKIRAIFQKAGLHSSYVSCPEFSREGTAITDTLWFDRIVAGSDDSTAAEYILELHRAIEHKRDDIAQIAGLTQRSQAKPTYLTTSISSAELIKVTANAFLALKISFANSIAKLADAAGADITAVMDGVGADRRIGKAFLQAGRGYGGGCFPKDVSGLIRSAEDQGIDMKIMQAAMAVNASMPRYVIHKACAAFGTDDTAWQNKKVAVLGLSFKAGTSDTRRSPAIAIANSLAELRAIVTAYDPEAMADAGPLLLSAVKQAGGTMDAIRDTDCIFIATDWPEFINLDWSGVALHAPGAMVVDCMNRLDAAAVRAAGLRYTGIGRS